MPKFKQAYESGRKYHTEWEDEFPWTCKAVDGSENAFCKLCKKSMQPRKKTLQNHSESADHKRHAAAVCSSRTINFSTVAVSGATNNDAIKRAEIELAVSVSCHSSFHTIDHFGEIISRNGKGSILQNLKLHRTKCSKLILNVIAPVLKEELQRDLVGKKFSLLVDEATDISSDKNFCVCIRYYSEKYERITTGLLEMIPVTDTTGEALFQAVKASLTHSDLSLHNCIGFASDGASNMIGEHNSLWSRIRKESPNCVQMRCICHSLALCIEKGFNKLPSHLGFILAEVPKWFSKSTLRREAYKELFNVMNPNQEQAATPLPFKKMSTTRWLVRGKVLYNILVNWEELKAYFMSVDQTSKQDVRYKARMLADMLNDEINYLYFCFATPIVKEFEEINALFQANDANAESMVKELDIHHKALKQRVYGTSGDLHHLSKVQFGARFLTDVKVFSQKHSGDKSIEEKILSLKLRCQEMLVELVTEVEQRLPKNTEVFRGLSALSPAKVLSQTDRLTFDELPYQHLLLSNLDEIESQYRKIVCHPWIEENVFISNKIPSDSVQFWTGVLKYKNTAGKKVYEELAMYALSCLSTPISNAVVERIFSQVACVKNKLRNKISLRTLDAVIRVRTVLMMQGKCCRDFVVSDQMLKRFNSEIMYCTDNEDNEDYSNIEVFDI